MMQSGNPFCGAFSSITLRNVIHVAGFLFLRSRCNCGVTHFQLNLILFRPFALAISYCFYGGQVFLKQHFFLRELLQMASSKQAVLRQ